MKRFQAGKCFHNDGGVQSAVTSWLQTLLAVDSYDIGIKTLVHLYCKCLNNDGDYVEK